jgi:hypothetical protein
MLGAVCPDGLAKRRDNGERDHGRTFTSASHRETEIDLIVASEAVDARFRTIAAKHIGAACGFE